jgi:hypothetical protein
MPIVPGPGALFKRVWLAAVVLAAVIASLGARADVPDADSHEVLHLLEYLRTSGCAMERNGKKHNSEDAYSHVKKKYDYFRAEITSSEGFIDYSASKSTMSNKYYLVYCEGESAVRTRDWLLEELRRYREEGRG